MNTVETDDLSAAAFRPARRPGGHVDIVDTFPRACPSPPRSRTPRIAGVLAKVLTCAVVGLDGALVEVEVDIGQGLPAFHDRRPARRRGPGGARARPRRDPQLAAASSRCRRITVNLAPGASCARRARPTTCRSRSASCAPPSRCPAEPPTGRSSWASCRSTARCATPTASCRWSRSRASAASRRVYVPAVDARRGGAGRRRRGRRRSATLAELVDAPARRRAARAASRRDRRADERAAPMAWSTSPTSGARSASSARSRSPRPAATTCCWSGPPGAGKTLLARALPGILPPLSPERGARGHARSTRSPACCRATARWCATRPFRAPHHTDQPRRAGRRRRAPSAPGEITPGPPRGAVPRRAARVRQPPARDAAPAARGRHVTIGRAPAARSTFPAKLMLVGAMNPCPCGYFGDPSQAVHLPPRRR